MFLGEYGSVMMLLPRRREKGGLGEEGKKCRKEKKRISK